LCTQRLALVGSAEQPAPLQQWDHLSAEDIEHRRQPGQHDLKPSAAPSVNQSSMRSAICSGVPACGTLPRRAADLRGYGDPSLPEAAPISSITAEPTPVSGAMGQGKIDPAGPQMNGLGKNRRSRVYRG
jgi:hypothetical protein